MKSHGSEFKLIDRGFSETLVLISGWATDYRIFEKLDLPYNYLFTIKLDPFNFKGRLREDLNNRHIDKISLFGYSLGGFLAYEFALGYPQMIDEFILTGIRKKYPKDTIAAVRARLKEDKEAYLRDFYTAFFSSADKESFIWFRKNLLKDYVENMRLEGLLSGLDYLENVTIDPQRLNPFQKLKIIHGKEDKIAPLVEVEGFRAFLPGARFIFFDRLGHIPFLSRQFKDRFYNG